MGVPSQEQIDEIIEWGLANRWSEDRILKHLATLERLTDEELAAFGVFPPAAKSARDITLDVTLGSRAAVTLAGPSADSGAPCKGNEVEEVEGALIRPPSG